MNKKRIRNFLIMLLVLIECTSIVLSIKSFKNREINEIKEENKIENDKFGMYLETIGTDGEITYEEYESSGIFPTGYKINLNKSKCEDINGQEVKDVISGRKTKITITSNKTLFCYVYFDIDYTLSQLCSNGEELGSCMIDHNDDIDSLNDNVEGGLYRYQGTNEVVEDNYICFGTHKKSECINNHDAYMYRIIGVDSNGQLKLIKKEALNETISWWSNYTTNKIWAESLIYQNINGEKYLTNNIYMPSGWSNKIVDYEWKYGDNANVNLTANELYAIENAWTNKVTAKIGLMYAHDYVYGLKGGNNCSVNGIYSICKTSWIHLSNNDSGAPNSGEWLMSRYGYYSPDKAYAGWHINNEGRLGFPALTYSRTIRPVFYLNSDEMYVNGNGTIDDPILLVDKEAPMGNSIVINNGIEYTINNNVTLSIKSNGATEMCISESETCTNWETYTTSKNYTLSSGLGIKTLYAYFRDEEGNASEAVNDTIKIIEEVKITTQPSDSAVAIGKTTEFSVVATGEEITYQWQFQTSTGTTWQTSTATGAKTSTVKVSGTSTNNGYKYRVIITDKYGNTVTSNAATLTAYALPSITTQPSDSAVAIGKTVKFSVVATGEEITYQWQFRASSSGSWQISTATGAKSATVSNTSIAARNGYQYRCIITDKYGNTVTSNAATLTAYALPSITTQPSDSAVAIGKTVKFSVVATGEEITYQWQYRASSSGSWQTSTATGAKTATVSNTSVAARNGYQYRCIITDKYGNTVTSNAATLTAYALPSITTQPSDSTVAIGKTTEFSVVATGEEITYQWQFQTSTGTTWQTSTATGAKTSTVKVSGASTNNGYKYRVIITDKYGNTVTSNTARLEVINSLGKYIQSLKPTGLNTTMEGGLYRFQGTTADNYICFETSNKDTCLEQPTTHLYRIIGINSNGQMKLIKNTALHIAFKWHNTPVAGPTWPESDLFKGLNGISGGRYNNIFIGSTNYMPNGWSDKIVDYEWKYGDSSNVDLSANELYAVENSWTNKVTAKIGLMYVHDYAYGLSGGNNCSKKYRTCKTSWIHINSNDTESPYNTEWTMSRSYGETQFSEAWSIFSDGYFIDYSVDLYDYVRPVFFLKSSVNYIGGTGTIDDPFIIS